MFRRMLVTSMIFSLIGSMALADHRIGESHGQANHKRRLTPKNVELDSNGNLNFALVDGTGRSVPEAMAVVIIDRHPQKVRANLQGKFVVPIRKSGIIVVVADDFTYGCRVWKHGTAPPRSLASIAFVKKQDAVAEVRGQGLGSALRATEKLYGLALLGLGGYALWQALDRDDDAS